MIAKIYLLHYGFIGAGTGCSTSQTSQANKLCGSIFAVTDAATINQVICGK